MPMQASAKTCVFALAAMVLAGCKSVQTTEPGVVGVDRKQNMLVSSKAVNSSAESNYRKIVAQAAGKGELNRDAALSARVRGIAQRLIPQTAVFRADAPAWQWEVNVITSKEVNAWCMPGGQDRRLYGADRPAAGDRRRNRGGHGS
jgi:predicted Zn-dependent protease